MRPTETPRPAVLNSETRCAPPSSTSIPDVPTRTTARTLDLSLKRQTALADSAVAAPTCACRAEAVKDWGLNSGEGPEPPQTGPSSGPSHAELCPWALP